MYRTVSRLSLLISRACCLIALILLTGLGCRPAMQVEGDTGEVAEVDADALRDRIDAALDYTWEKRRLNTRDHAAWQILHGVLAYGPNFPVEHEGKLYPTVEYLQSGGLMKGWTMERGNRLERTNEDGSPRYGLRAVVEPGTQTGQGHYDQWLAILSQCDMPETAEFKIGDDTYTIADWIAQVQLDMSRNPEKEFSWTLIGLTAYLPTDASWTDSQGKQWTMEELVQAELDHGFGTGACGGSHRLIGISMALNRHLAQGGKLEGAWAEAEEIVREKAITQARQYQNRDGSFSSNYFLRSGVAADLAETLGSSGHTLEFMTLSLTESELSEPWVMHATNYLSGVFERTEGIALECGALYHAAHALILYRQRVYGPRDFEMPSGTPEDVAPSI